MDFLTTILNSQAVTDGIGAYRDVRISGDALRQQQLGMNGWFMNGAINPQFMQQPLNPNVLLIGAAVLLFVFLKK